jgi:hypothetical protein
MSDMDQASLDHLDYYGFIEALIADVWISRNFIITEGIHEWREQTVKIIHYDCHKAPKPSMHYFVEYYLGCEVVDKDGLRWVLMPQVIVGSVGGGLGSFREVGISEIEAFISAIEDKSGKAILV